MTRNDVSKSNVKTLSTVITIQNTLARDHIFATTKTKKMKASKTHVTQSTAKVTMTAETPKLVSTTPVNQSIANTMTIAVKIISVKRSTKKIQERTSAKKLTVLLMPLANITLIQNVKMVYVSVRTTSVNHKNVSNLNTVQTNTIAMITNVLNKNVAPMNTVMATTPHTNVSLTVSPSPTPTIPTKSRNAPVPVNQSNVERRQTVTQVTLQLTHLSWPKFVMVQPMTETHNVLKLNAAAVNSVVTNKSVSRISVRLLNAEPMLIANHSISMVNSTSVMPSSTSVSKSTVLDTMPVVNTKDVRVINALLFHVPPTNTVHQTLFLVSTKNVVKTTVNVSTLNAKVMLPVMVSQIPLLVMTVPMENANASKTNVSNTNAEPENIVPILVSTNTSVLTMSVLK